MKNRLVNYLRAGYPCLYLVSHEENRVERLLVEVAAASERQLFAWSSTQGLCAIVNETPTATEMDELEVLANVADMPANSILLLRDYHLYFAEPNPMLIRRFKDALFLAKAHSIGLIVLGGKLTLPDELTKLVTVLDFELPDRDALKFVVQMLCENNGQKVPKGQALDAILDAASGLTTTEAEDAIALSIIECSEISAAVLLREKANTVRKNGLLEIVDRKVTLDDIGGLEVFKEDLLSNRFLFTKAARDYGLESPRALLVIGQAGTGKSLTAQAAGSIFDATLLRLEAGQLFGSLVGQSEERWRTAFATAKAVAPCILWIDEADGLFSGGKNSGTTDGGTTQRVIKAILQDMQFNSAGVMFLFTANDIDGIPDPLIDRSDVWFVDLPNDAEREAIWRIHIAKRKRDPGKFDLKALSEATKGFSGRQIEDCWLKAMKTAFNDGQGRREVTQADAMAVCKKTVPTGVTMSDAIISRRKRLEGRARHASTADITPAPIGQSARKLDTKKAAA